MASPGEVLGLYRHILKAAKHFPSIKRNQILQDIRSEFRANRDLRDPSKVMQAVEVAQRSLEQLQAYTGLDRGSHDWQVSLKGACD